MPSTVDFCLQVNIVLVLDQSLSKPYLVLPIQPQANVPVMAKTLTSKVKVLVIGHLEEWRREKYSNLIQFQVSRSCELWIATWIKTKPRLAYILMLALNV
jgi:hypothetical protein